ncbi:MAG TPA: 16S rRNA (uracil(1498)-N(3))-methyltransferase [Proteobacteria bacterium]|nr:16S rRNA (uracil(1498)-N(3))-methyltransferase [Pseudomonadota bacterium]
MNLILLQAEDFVAPHRVLLRDRRARHIRKVLRADPGFSLRVGLVNGNLGRGLILACGRDQVEMEVALVSSPPPPLPITLLLALPRPKVFKRVLAAAVTMGVKRVFLFNTWRVEKGYWQTSLLQPESLRQILFEALEQAGDTQLPEVFFRPRFRPFVEDEVPDLVAGRKAWLLHPDSDSIPILGLKELALLAVGPEGGFIPFEVELLARAGLQLGGLGTRILRVEQAVPAILGRCLGSGGR